jgi:hypothetical protein
MYIYIHTHIYMYTCVYVRGASSGLALQRAAAGVVLSQGLGTMTAVQTHGLRAVKAARRELVLRPYIYIYTHNIYIYVYIYTYLPADNTEKGARQPEEASM